MSRQALRHTKEQLEKILEQLGSDNEVLGSVLGQLGQVNMALGSEVDALVNLLASQILLVSLGTQQAAAVEVQIAKLRSNMGEERFLEVFHKALPQAGFLLVQYMGRDEAEAVLEAFARRKSA